MKKKIKELEYRMSLDLRTEDGRIAQALIAKEAMDWLIPEVKRLQGIVEASDKRKAELKAKWECV